MNQDERGQQNLQDITDRNSVERDENYPCTTDQRDRTAALKRRE